MNVTRAKAATSFLASALSGCIDGCLTCQRPDICSMTSLESIRTATVSAPRSCAAARAGPKARRWIAPYASFVTGDGTGGADDLAEAVAAVGRERLSWPLVAKPDIGCNGTGVRLAPDPDTLARILPG